MRLSHTICFWVSKEFCEEDSKQCEYRYFHPVSIFLRCHQTMAFTHLTLAFHGSSVRKNIVANVFCAIVIALIFVFFDEFF